MEDIIVCNRPVQFEDCYFMRDCRNCSVFLRAAGGEKNLVCFDLIKMRENVINFYEGI